jgi:hypothetical protein
VFATARSAVGSLATDAVALPPNPPKRLRVTDRAGEAHRPRRNVPDLLHTLEVWKRLKLTGDSCDTRDRVLLRDGLGTMAVANCTITAVHWRSIYDGTITTVRRRRR